MLRTVALLAAVLAASVLVAGPAAADHCTDGDATATPCSHDDSDDGGGPIVNVELGPLVEKLDQILDFLTGAGDYVLTDVLTDAILAAVFEPVRRLLEVVVNLIAGLLTWYPQVYPNEDVADVHRVSLGIAALFTVVVFLVAAVLHLVQDWLSFTPSPVLWKIVPRAVVAVGLSTVSLPFIQHLVDGTVIVAHLFLSRDVSILAGTSVTGGLLIAGVINVVLLVLVAALYVLKGLFVLYVAGLSPLILLAWSTPWTRKYAAVFVKGFTTALLVAPLSAAAFRLSIGLLEPGSVAELPDWILGMAMLILLLVVPWMVWSASGWMLLQASQLAYQTRRKAIREIQESDRIEIDHPMFRIDRDEPDVAWHPRPRRHGTRRRPR